MSLVEFSALVAPFEWYAAPFEQLRFFCIELEPWYGARMMYLVCLVEQIKEFTVPCVALISNYGHRALVLCQPREPDNCTSHFCLKRLHNELPWPK